MLKNTLLAAVAVLTLSTASATAGDYRYVNRPVVKVSPYVNPHVQPSRPYLGVAGHYQGAGFYIDRVDFGSPAARMGLERGDTILSFNGRRIHCDADFRATLAGCTRHVNMRVLCVRRHAVVNVYGSLTPAPQPPIHYHHSYGPVGYID